MTEGKSSAFPNVLQARSTKRLRGGMSVWLLAVIQLQHSLVVSAHTDSSIRATAETTPTEADKAANPFLAKEIGNDPCAFGHYNESGMRCLHSNKHDDEDAAERNVEPCPGVEDPTKLLTEVCGIRIRPHFVLYCSSCSDHLMGKEGMPRRMSLLSGGKTTETDYWKPLGDGYCLAGKVQSFALGGWRTPPISCEGADLVCHCLDAKMEWFEKDAMCSTGRPCTTKMSSEKADKVETAEENDAALGRSQMDQQFTTGARIILRKDAPNLVYGPAGISVLKEASEDGPQYGAPNDANSPTCSVKNPVEVEKGAVGKLAKVLGDVALVIWDAFLKQNCIEVNAQVDKNNLDQEHPASFIFLREDDDKTDEAEEEKHFLPECKKALSSRQNEKNPSGKEIKMRRPIGSAWCESLASDICHHYFKTDLKVKGKRKHAHAYCATNYDSIKKSKPRLVPAGTAQNEAWEWRTWAILRVYTPEFETWPTRIEDFRIIPITTDPENPSEKELQEALRREEIKLNPGEAERKGSKGSKDHTWLIVLAIAIVVMIIGVAVAAWFVKSRNQQEPEALSNHEPVEIGGEAHESHQDASNHAN